MSGPKRWRDDPELLEELGLDLDAEAKSLASHDLGAMQHAVEAKIAAGASAGIGPYLIGGLLIAAVGAGVATYEPATNGPELVDAPVATKVDFDAKRIVEKKTPTAPEPKTAAKKRVAPAAPEPAAEPAKAPAPTDLAAQLDRYERGQRALTENRPADAITAFTSYLSDYPNGRLVMEAQLGLLHARFATEQYAEAAKSAEALIASPLASHRRKEILRVLAESRAMLGECERAAAAFDASFADPAVRERAIARCRALRVD